MERHRRDSARVLLLDPDGRVLLIRVDDPTNTAPPVWITPGGGIEPGEDAVTAAARELLEETGLVATADELGTPVAFSRGDWEFRGVPLHSEDWCFVLRCAPFELDDSGWTAIERDLHVEWRWFTCAELDALDEIVLPNGLPGLLRDLIAGVTFTEPVELPWLEV